MKMLFYSLAVKTKLTGILWSLGSFTTVLLALPKHRVVPPRKHVKSRSSVVHKKIRQLKLRGLERKKRCPSVPLVCVTSHTVLKTARHWIPSSPPFYGKTPRCVRAEVAGREAGPTRLSMPQLTVTQHARRARGERTTFPWRCSENAELKRDLHGTPVPESDGSIPPARGLPAVGYPASPVHSREVRSDKERKLLEHWHPQKPPHSHSAAAASYPQRCSRRSRCRQASSMSWSPSGHLALYTKESPPRACSSALEFRRPYRHTPELHTRRRE